LAKGLVYLSSFAAVIWLIKSILSAQGVVPAYAFKNKTVATLCLQACAVASLPVLVLILLIMMLRLNSGGADPLKGEEPELLKVTKLALNNTMEQSFIFVVNLLAASTYDDHNKEALVLLTAAFVLGRLLFWVGYVAATFSEIPVLRSPGFILTIGSNVAIIGLNTFKLWEQIFT